MYKLDLEKAEETDQTANIPWIIKKKKKKTRELQKRIYFCLIDYTKAFDCVGHNKHCGKLLKRGNTCILQNLHIGQEVTI